jgi:hypothetical protein
MAHMDHHHSDLADPAPQRPHCAGLTEAQTNGIRAASRELIDDDAHQIP